MSDGFKEVGGGEYAPDLTPEQERNADRAARALYSTRRGPGSVSGFAIEAESNDETAPQFKVKK